MSWMIIFILIGIVIVDIYVFFVIYWMVSGAPYAPSKQKAINQMITFAVEMQAKRVADLGAGDGRIIIELAKQGIEAHGYEINPLLVLLARKNIKKNHLENKAKIYWKSFWKADFSQYDVVCIYPIGYIMNRLGKKLEIEIY